MSHYFYFIIFLTTLTMAATINTPFQTEEQRKVYEKLQNVDITLPSSPIVIPELKTIDEKNDSICFITHTIILHNNTLLSETEKNRVIAPYLEQCNGISVLRTLADKMTKLYMDKGYITSRVYLTPQDIADGEIDYFAIEGKIARIDTDSRKTTNAFIGLKGRTLDLTKLETSIEQVNRLRSNTTTMQLLPSEQEGYSDVVLTSKETQPLFGSLGINNYGSEATGKFQLSAGLVWENVLGWSDIITINLNTTDEHHSGQNSTGNSYRYSIPFGAWLWEASASNFQYEQTIYGLNNSYISYGESDIYSLGTTYKAFHNQTQKIELNAQIAQKKNKSKIDDTMIDTSTYNLTVGDIGLNYVYRLSSGELYGLLNYYHGLNAFNPTTEGALKHDFSKWTLAVGATKYFNGTLPITYQFSGYAQHSNDLLYSTEQISIGGAYSVRGFQTKNISGESGWYARNDLLFQMTSYFSPYIAYDLGHIQSDISTEGGSLRSASIGIRGQYGLLSMDIYHAIPFSSPNKTFDTDPFIGISASANF